MPEGILNQTPIEVIRWMLFATKSLAIRLQALETVKEPIKILSSDDFVKIELVLRSFLAQFSLEFSKKLYMNLMDYQT